MTNAWPHLYTAQARLLFAVVVVFVHLALMALLARALPDLRLGRWPDLGATLVNFGGLIFALAVGSFVGLRATGLRLTRPSHVLTLLPLLLIALSFSFWGSAGAQTPWWSSAALFLVLGLNEEALNRGVVQSVLARHSVTGAVWLSAALFGLGHLGSAVFYGHPWSTTLAQVVSATAFGVAFGAVRLKVGVVWPLALLHALSNFCLTRASGVPAAWFLSVALLHLGYGALLLRTRPRQPC